MLVIRLSRVGRKNNPSYRIIVSEKTKDPFGRFLEILGFYDPKSKNCDLKKDRILFWISKGAQLSDTIHNLFVDKNIIQEKKIKASRGKKKNIPEEVNTPKIATPSAPVEPVTA